MGIVVTDYNENACKINSLTLGLDRYQYRVSGIGRYCGIGQVSVSGKKQADTDTINYLCSNACSALQATFTVTVGIDILLSMLKCSC